jgi:hypothetical protein
MRTSFRTVFISMVSILLWSAAWNVFPATLVSVAEQSDYKKTSYYKDVMDLLFEAQKQSSCINIIKFTTSYEGRMVPMVVIAKEGIKSPLELAASGKPAVLIMANIHAGEIEGKEAMMMFIRDIVENKASEYLENQVLLVLPIFNADGNDKMGHNRGDNGPELAGVRYNGQSLDLNRDYLKLESPEVCALVKVLNQWDPVVVIDMHTTNGSWHRIPVTYSSLTNPNSDMNLFDYMWKTFFPAVTKTLKDTYGYDSIPYGNFSDNLAPEKGWENDTFLARYGSNYVGMRNRFTVLDENYSHADYKTRVLSSYCFIKSVLQYTNRNIKKMKEMVIASDLKTRDSFFKANFALDFNIEKLSEVTIKSFKFDIEKIKPEDKDKYPPWIKDYIAKRTEELKDYTIPYFAKAVPSKSIPLPEAYVLGPFHPGVVENLKKHGIIVEKITKEVKMQVEVFKITELKPAAQIYQGHVPISLKGSYAVEERVIPENSYFISMKQPLARLIPVLLEPESADSLAGWGFFNRVLVEQWTGRPGTYPIFRIPKLNFPIERFQE